MFFAYEAFSVSCHQIYLKPAWFLVIFFSFLNNLCYFFWQAVVWIFFAIFSLIRFQADYLLVVGVCLTLSIANIIGFTKCRKGLFTDRCLSQVLDFPLDSTSVLNSVISTIRLRHLAERPLNILHCVYFDKCLFACFEFHKYAVKECSKLSGARTTLCCPTPLWMHACSCFYGFLHQASLLLLFY